MEAPAVRARAADPGELDRVVPGRERRMGLGVAIAFVAGGHGHDHVGDVEVVDGLGQEVLDAVGAAAEAHVHDVHAVRVGGIERVEDVLGAGVRDVAREDVVVAEERRRRDAGRVVRERSRADAGRARLVVAGDRAGDVRAVVVDRLGIEAVLVALVVEDLGDDDLVVRVLELALREARRGRVAGVIEAGVILVDAGVDDADLDALAGVGGAADLRPRPCIALTRPRSMSSAVW